MVAKTFAVILALVMANPVCCCAFRASLEPGKAPFRSWCAGNQFNSDGKNESATSGPKPDSLETCVVSDKKLSSMGDPYQIVHQGQEIKFC